MTPAALLLAEAERRLTARCEDLGQRLDAGEDVWHEYVSAITTLHALVSAERRPLATTAEMAQKYQVTPKTVRRWGRTGKLAAERLGQRGRAAIRWRTA